MYVFMYSHLCTHPQGPLPTLTTAAIQRFASIQDLLTVLGYLDQQGVGAMINPLTAHVIDGPSVVHGLRRKENER